MKYIYMLQDIELHAGEEFTFPVACRIVHIIRAHAATSETVYMTVLTEMVMPL